MSPRTYAPPQNLDAEESVLGAMLLSPGAIRTVREAGLTADAFFYRESHGTIYTVACELDERGTPVDAITLGHELEGRGLLEKIGGLARLNELAALVPAIGNAGHYARIVREKAEDRGLIRELEPLLTSARNGGVDRLDALERLARASASLAPSAPQRPVAVTLDEFIAESGEAPAALLGTDDDSVLPAGGLLLHGGKPGVGKTTLALDAAFHLAAGIPWLGLAVSRPQRVLIIENEGPRESFRRKLERKRSVWPNATGALYVHTFSWGDLTLTDAATRSALKRFIDTHEIELVVGDPLTALGVEGVGSPAETRDFVQLLKALGLGGQVAFWLLHHFRKEPTTDEIDQLSGAWGGHADAILVMKEATGDRVRLSFPKLRWGEPRDAFFLSREREQVTFTVAAVEAAGGRDLVAEITALLASDGKWRTLNEIAAKKDGGVGANKDTVKAKLVVLVKAGGVEYEEGPTGRAKDAKCWRLAQADEPPRATHTPAEGLEGSSAPRPIRGRSHQATEAGPPSPNPPEPTQAEEGTRTDAFESVPV